MFDAVKFAQAVSYPLILTENMRVVAGVETDLDIRAGIIDGLDTFRKIATTLIGVYADENDYDALDYFMRLHTIIIAQGILNRDLAVIGRIEEKYSRGIDIATNGLADGLIARISEQFGEATKLMVYPCTCSECEYQSDTGNDKR